MPSPIYTLGYAQWTADEVDDQLQLLGAVLVDVRRSPQTTKPGFTKDELDARFGSRYVHVPAFGNVNYKEGPIELAQPKLGMATVQSLSRPPVLMCGCQAPAQCHRSTVATRLAEEWAVSVTHLRAPSERAQPGLFSDQ